MKLIRVAAVVLNQTPLDWEGNQVRILGALDAARSARASIVCLPELCITGYGCEDAFYAPHVQRTALEVLGDLLPATRGLVASVGLPLLFNGALFNTACLIADGEILGFVGKQNLAGEGIHYEPRWFKGWPSRRVARVEFAGRSYPLGDLLFDVGGVRLGFEICEDAWVAHRPGAQLAQAGVDVLLNPSASHFAFGKHEIRRRFVLEGSRAFHVSYVYANLLGNEAGRAIYDGDAMIASGGTLLANGPRFSFRDFHVTVADVDVEATRMNRSRQQSFRMELWDDDARLVKCPFSYPPVAPQPRAAGMAAWESEAYVKEEEFTRAVGLALFDYLRKSASRGFVVSLSGGADSAAVACLSAFAFRLAAQELGAEPLQRKLGYLFADYQASTAEPGGAAVPAGTLDSSELVRRMVTCVYQSTRNSSDVTRQAAQGVAAALGAEFLEFDVDALVHGYEQQVSGAIQRPLSWQHDDIARQNIQARVRSPGVWLLANLRGALLLSTSNRSEAAVGYATMDGDTSGGLSPIAGIDKAFLRRWLRWLERSGPEGLGSVPALALVNQQQPTAELRPAAAHQTDEQDLMPYDLLDEIERAAIRDKLSPLEVFQVLEPRRPEYSGQQLLVWIKRFFQLWCRNQWKRERYAPSFHLDDENLDPKTWCRFPILSGGYRRELAELERYVAAGRPGHRAGS